MNILAVIIALGVGADDTFILARVWQQQQSKEPGRKLESLESLVSNTLQHAILSMLVTSMTTTVAFFSSYVSNITAIKCFRYKPLQNHYMDWKKCSKETKIVWNKICLAIFWLYFSFYI